MAKHANVVDIDVMGNGCRIQDPEVSQPLCTALQLALVELLRTFSVEPVAVLGHSSGEIAAAYSIGALSHESACKVAYYRGQVAAKVRCASISTPGAMMSVGLAESQLFAHLDQFGVRKGTIHIACVNSPSNVTLSGPAQALHSLKTHLDQRGIFAQIVNTGVAYHSPAMEAVSAEYLDAMEGLQPGSASTDSVLMISSVTGKPVEPKTLSTPQYWVDNLISPVRFADALRRLEDGPPMLPLPLGTGSITDVIEVGPHGALRRPIKDTVPSLRYHSVLDRTKPPMHTTLQLLGELFCHGHPVSIVVGNQQTENSVPYLVDCPPYPFDHSKRYWSESRLSRDYRLRGPSPGFLLGTPASDWNPLQPRWRSWLCTETIPWLADHTVSFRSVLILLILEFFPYTPITSSILSLYHFKTILSLIQLRSILMVSKSRHDLMSWEHLSGLIWLTILD